MLNVKNKTIINNNGDEYHVLDEKGSYSLLERTTGGYQPFVVAWCLQEYKDKYVWGQGHYFDKKEDAEEYFSNM